MKEHKILVKAWMTKMDKGLPMRTMVGTIERQSSKAYYMKLHGQPEPSTKCLHCNRKLTHPVSQIYGIGPICGQHYHINPLNSEKELEEKMEEIKSKLESITWEGWIPKSQILEMNEVSTQLDEVLEKASEKFDVVFKYEGVLYRTVTNADKLYEIRQNSEIIELEQVI